MSEENLKDKVQLNLNLEKREFDHQVSTSSLVEQEQKSGPWESKVNLYRPSFIPKSAKETVSDINFYQPRVIAGEISANNSTASNTNSKLEVVVINAQDEDFRNISNTVSEDIGSIGSFGKIEETFATDSLDIDDHDHESCSSEESFLQKEITGSWGCPGYNEMSWNTTDHETVFFQKYEDLNLNDDELEGVLTDKIIASCSSDLKRSPETGQYVLCKLVLAGKDLTNIDILTYHHYIQHLNLSSNKLEDISSLSELPFLMYLDVSNNSLTNVLDFKAPYNLTYANFSENYIMVIDDLSAFWSLVSLDLSNNLITKIQGLEKLKYLRYLNLSNNEISVIENLNNMHLLVLNLDFNTLTEFERGPRTGLKTLNNILSVNLGHNELLTLKMFKGAHNIESIEIKNNKIEDPYELTYLSGLPVLYSLDMSGNPITAHEAYREVALGFLKNLMFLDGDYIPQKEKAEARFKFNAPTIMKAAQKESLLFFNSQLNFPIISPAIVPVDQPPPMMILLVGPPGSCKRAILAKLMEEFPDLLELGVSHTTRDRLVDEEEGTSYYFLTRYDFASMVRRGEFLTVSEIIGNSYGFAYSELVKVTGTEKIMITHMDLGGALTLRARGLLPHLIMLMPSTFEMHRSLLNRTYCCVKSEYYHIKNWPSRARLTNPYDGTYDGSVMSIVQETLDDIINSIPTDEVIEGEGSEGSPDMNFSTAATENEYDYPSTGKFLSLYSNSSYGPSGRTDQAVVTKTQNIKFNIYDTYDKPYDTSPFYAPQGTQVFDVEPEDGEIGNSEEAYDHLEESSSLQTDYDTFGSKNVKFSKETKYLPIGTSNLPSVSANIIDSQENIPILSVLSKPEFISGTSLVADEPTDKASLNLFFNDIKMLRAHYLNFHNENPGVFEEVLCSDDPEQAVDSLSKIIKRCLRKKQYREPLYKYNDDPAYKTMVKQRLDSLKKELDIDITKTSQTCSPVPCPDDIDFV